jgi:VanZ family protein
MSVVKNFWLFFVWMGVILYLSFTPLTSWPKLTVFDKLYLDKIVHICMYSMLSFLLLRSFFRQQSNHLPRYSVLISSVLFCAAMGATIEFLQPVLTMYRQFEWLDMIANAIGALCGYFLFSLFLKKQWLGIKLQSVN